VLLDCGAGTVHALAREGLDWQQLTHVVLSHFHTDHVGDLPALLWALRYGIPEGRTLPLTLLGPVGLQSFMAALARAHGGWILEPGFALRICELEPSIPHPSPHADERYPPLRVETLSARHSPEALVLILELTGVRVGYTGDTGPFEGLSDFFQGVDLLIAECGQRDPLPPDPIHLSPITLGRLAGAANPGLLVPVHLYPEVPRDTLIEVLRREGAGCPIRLGEDGLKIDLPLSP
jgi:ribonuclease BN (tRNA processing enzyme)